MSGNRSIELRDWSEVLALGAIVGVFALLSPDFLGSRNLSMLAIELSTTAILALGMFLVILPGHIDLSAGSGVGLIGGVAAVLITRSGWPAPLAMLAAGALALLLWHGMGKLIVTQKMPAFIITLGGLLAFKGLFWLVIQNSTVSVSPAGAPNILARLTTTYLPPAWGWALAATTAAVLLGGWWRRAEAAKKDGLSYDAEAGFLKAFLGAQCVALFVAVTNGFRGVPLPAILLAVSAFLVLILTEHTAFGRRLYAIGGNPEAALLAGIDVDKTVITAFALMGAAVAVTGFLQTAYAGASTTTVGDLMELDAIAACVIGGTSLNGGRGNVRGVLFGALIMAALLNGMTLLAVAPEIKYVTRGVVLALAVWLDTRLSR
ncbi:MAG: ATPase [Elusimicrobia bacterium]|nr:ATPase [Elusimicrobiota bacterium]MDE2510225.1 ATPase [Elusimicrobiota bacterium]